MALEERQFPSSDELTIYLIQEAGRSPELTAEVIEIAVRDGAAAIDNGSVYGFHSWTITYEDGIFGVEHEFGYLADGGVVI